ncbi:MAG: acyl--CoA ligase [Proteobacteria bacterium]|nr:acyl--CoA ligase [Pseudomonadota bacterium]MBU4471417.1 acyl--CoA ligase [Pseudomonadota bacterium]MCG2752422.1 acyl--CoA ligase [Desulfobacteraceae bacterium]
MGKNSPNIIANSLISIAKYNPSGEHMICGDRRITWGEDILRTFKMAQALKKAGIGKGDKVTFMFHNSPAFVETNAAIQVAGAIPVPMNYRFIPGEVEYQGKHCDAKAMIYDNIWAESVEPALENIPNIKHVICRGKSGLSRAVDYEEFIHSGTAEDPAVETTLEDVAVMIYTGGTTGRPKGVLLTYGAHVEMFSTMFASATTRTLSLEIPLERHKLMVEKMEIPGKWLIGPLLRSKTFKKIMSRPGIYDFLKESSHNTYLDPERAKGRYDRTTKSMSPSMPYFHVAAYQGLIANSLNGRGCAVLLESPKFDPDLILQLVEKEEVQGMANVPTGWKKLVSLPDRAKYNVSSIRAVTTGGGVCNKELKKQILEMFPGAMLIDALGQTEMTPVTSFRVDGDPDNIKDRSVGKTIVECKIADDQGNELPKGETGEVYYRSNSVMKGYYKDEEKTKEVLEKGWFKSGDLGFLDENDELITVDRKNECINTGGEKVFPLEVEEIIQTHPKVDSVCVIGVPDEEWGSSVRAVVQAKPGEKLEVQEIMDFCRGKMAGYKIPRSIKIVEEIPVSPVGKVLRQKVRDSFGARV